MPATNATETIYVPSCGMMSCRTCARYDSDGYDEAGYDRYGFGRDGYSRCGFDRLDIHRNGTDFDDDGYGASGYNADGYDRGGYDRDGYNEDGNDCYGESRPCDCGDCAECRDNDPDYYDSDDGGALHDYSYRPSLQFRGDSGPYFGMEIEVTSDRIRDLVETVDRYAGDLIYCKADGSVEGAELVTHPMSYEWAMKKFPWDLLPALRTAADATIVQQENGIHVHVSRDGFDGSAHMFRWMKLWYRNPNDIQRIARRRSSNWAAFSPDHRAAQKEAVKYGKRGYQRSRDDTRYDRYSAINTVNADTLEVRVFASTLRPERAKAALQLVAASVEYTRQLSADDVCHRHGWDWKAFMAWTAKSGQYPALVAEDRVRRPL